MYRLYEIVQNYGYAYKAVMNEKFGDGIMSAISFSTKVSFGRTLLGVGMDISLGLNRDMLLSRASHCIRKTSGVDGCKI